MLIINSNILLGDSIAALPAIWQKSQEEKVFLVSHNKKVASLLQESPNIVHINQVKDFFNSDFDVETQIRHLNANPNFYRYCAHDVHMAQGYFPFLDLPLPSNIPTCPLNVDWRELPDFNTSFDFLISAGSRSDSQNNKLWPYENWQIIIDWLKESNYTIAALTSGRNDEHHFNNLDGEANGLSLKEVGGAYIKKVKKAVISIDNGISHFTRLLGAPHILLYPQCLPRTWVNNPNSNCLILQKEPLQLTVDEVKALIGIFLATHASSV